MTGVRIIRMRHDARATDPGTRYRAERSKLLAPGRAAAGDGAWRSAAENCRRGPGPRPAAAGSGREPSPAPRRDAATARPSRTAPCVRLLVGPPVPANRTGGSRTYRCGCSGGVPGGRSSKLGAPVIGETAQMRDDEGDIRVLGRQQLDDRDLSDRVVKNG